MPGMEAMIGGNSALGHIGGNHRQLHQLGELHAFPGGFGQDDAAAHDQRRPLGSPNHFDRLPDRNRCRAWILKNQRLVVGHVIIDFGHLHIQGQVDHDNAGFARFRQHECFLHHLHNILRIRHAESCFGYRCTNFCNVHTLKRILAELRRHGLAGQGNQRNGIHIGRIYAGDEIGRPRA